MKKQITNKKQTWIVKLALIGQTISKIFSFKIGRWIRWTSNTCPTKMSSIEQLIVIYLDNRSVFHKDNFFFSLDFFVVFYENRFYMPLHNWILQIALIALKIGSNETNVVSEENVWLIGSIHLFRNYELRIMNFHDFYDQSEQLFTNIFGQNLHWKLGHLKVS